MAFGRLVGTVDAIAIDLPGQHIGQVGVPDHVGLLGHCDATRFFGGLGRIEQAKLDLVGVLRIEREIRAAAIPGGAQRVRPTRQHAQTVHKAPFF